MLIQQLKEQRGKLDDMNSKIIKIAGFYHDSFYLFSLNKKQFDKKKYEYYLLIVCVSLP